MPYSVTQGWVVFPDGRPSVSGGKAADLETAQALRYGAFFVLYQIVQRVIAAVRRSAKVRQARPLPGAALSRGNVSW